jgi:hypothetical protein
VSRQSDGAIGEIRTLQGWHCYPCEPLRQRMWFEPTTIVASSCGWSSRTTSGACSRTGRQEAVVVSCDLRHRCTQGFAKQSAVAPGRKGTLLFGTMGRWTTKILHWLHYFVDGFGGHCPLSMDGSSKSIAPRYGTAAVATVLGLDDRTKANVLNRGIQSIVRGRTWP